MLINYRTTEILMAALNICSTRTDNVLDPSAIILMNRLSLDDLELDISPDLIVEVKQQCVLQPRRHKSHNLTTRSRRC